MNRRSTPRVRHGKVQRKNRTDLSPHYSIATPGDPVIDRERPGEGYKHVVRKRDVQRFLGLLPDWEELSRGLKAVVLAEGEWDTLGWHYPGVVAVCAWDREIDGDWTKSFVEDHAPILERLGLDTICDPLSDHVYLEWTVDSVRAFLLMHVLLHELGHHHDRMTTRSQARAARGESYAEQYALKYAERLWEAYYREFE